VAGKGASQETGPRAPNPLAFRGERRSFHAHVFLKSILLCAKYLRLRWILPRVLTVLLLIAAASASFAASIRGVVTDTTGAKSLARMWS
jgi:hypothetical protein